MSKRIIKIGDNATVNAPVTIADEIENSFNAVAKSGVDSEVRSLVDQLLVEITEISEHLDEAQAEEIAESAELLSKEIAKGSPKRRWYEFSLSCIKDVASKVGEVGVPLIKTISTLLPILIQHFPK